MKQMYETYEHYKRIKAKTCLDCGREMTWAEQRRQFGRAIRAGFCVTGNAGPHGAA